MEIKNDKNHIRIGESGENLACEYLVQKEWKLLARNYRRKSDEIDVIALSGDGTLVFCEVKALRIREGQQSGNFAPEDNLSPVKFRKIARTCQFFARQHPELVNEERGWRIDLIAVDIGPDGRPSSIRHYENI